MHFNKRVKRAPTTKQHHILNCERCVSTFTGWKCVHDSLFSFQWIQTIIVGASYSRYLSFSRFFVYLSFQRALLSSIRLSSKSRRKKINYFEDFPIKQRRTRRYNEANDRKLEPYLIETNQTFLFLLYSSLLFYISYTFFFGVEWHPNPFQFQIETLAPHSPSKMCIYMHVNTFSCRRRDRIFQ